MGEELLALAEMTYAAVEIGVSCLVAADESSDKGQEMVEIEAIEGPNDGIGGIGELKDSELSTRPQNAVHLAQACIEVTEIAAAISAGDTIERGIGKRHSLGIAIDKFDGESPSLAFLPSYTHHLHREVDTRELLSFALTENLDSQIARTDSYVKDAGSGRH